MTHEPKRLVYCNFRFIVIEKLRYRLQSIVRCIHVRNVEIRGNLPDERVEEYINRLKVGRWK